MLPSLTPCSRLLLTFEQNLINNQASDYVYYSQLTDPTFENPFFLYTSEMYKDYALEMAEYAAAGIWPSDAISNTNGISTLFQNKQSATTYQNYYNGITWIEATREKGSTASCSTSTPRAIAHCVTPI